MQNNNQVYQQPTIVDDFMDVDESQFMIRLGFLRKVYGILSVQIAFTTFVGIVMSWTGLHENLKSNSFVLIINLIATFIITITPMVKQRSYYPNNYYLLAAFTFFESISLGLIASFHSKCVVIQAFILTTLIVIKLTLNTLESKRDLRGMGKFLFTVYFWFMFGAFLLIFFYNETAQTVLVAFGALIFSGYVVYDTHMIFKHLNPEEYISGVIRLYFDIIYLYWDILKFMELRQY